jgi:hypothetical protein
VLASIWAAKSFLLATISVQLACDLKTAAEEMFESVEVNGNFSRCRTLRNAILGWTTAKNGLTDQAST